MADTEKTAPATLTLQQALDGGAILLSQGRTDEANRLAEKLMARCAGDPNVHLFAADAAASHGDLKGAIAYLEASPAMPGANARVLLRRAQLQFADSQRQAALDTVRSAMGLVADDERQLRAVARILIDCQQAEEARDWLLQAHARLPQSAGILYDLAIAEFHLNMPDAAAGHVATLLAGEPYFPGALHLRSLLRSWSPDNNNIEDLHERLASAPANPRLTTVVNYALGKEYEDLGRFEDAFNAVSAGAAACRSTIEYDSAAELAAQRAIREGVTAQRLAALPPGFDEPGPLFVIGMPRSGTTLVERLLDAHSQAASVGEFRDFPKLLGEMARDAAPAEASDVEASLAVNFRELGQRYVQAARQLIGTTPRFVDKLPYNFLYCGYLVAALPQARIVHLVRNPLDSAYAVYKTLFFQAYNFSYDLDELADYIVSYREHMAHWHRVLPGRILDVAYEDLVREPDAQARRILQYCGLPWEDAVAEFQAREAPSMTASALQVRQPLHERSVGSWRRAGSAFDRLQERFQQAGLLE